MRHFISFKRVFRLGAFVAFAFSISYGDLHAQSCAEMLKKNAITDTLFTNRLMARTYKITPQKKAIIPYVLYSGRSYFIKMAKNDPNDHVKLRVLIKFNSQLEPIWDNISSQENQTTLCMGNTQRVFFEFSLEKTDTNQDIHHPACVGLLINSYEWDKPSDKKPANNQPTSPPDNPEW